MKKIIFLLVHCFLYDTYIKIVNVSLETIMKSIKYNPNRYYLDNNNYKVNRVFHDKKLECWRIIFNFHSKEGGLDFLFFCVK